MLEIRQLLIPIGSKHLEVGIANGILWTLPTRSFVTPIRRKEDRGRLQDDTTTGFDF